MCKAIWQHQLWPHRPDIDTHSVMTWIDHSEPYDQSIWNYDVSYWGAFDHDHLVGVNSGHSTSDTEYRSRGLWVHPDYRLQGISQMLFEKTILQAISEDRIVIWSLPRVSALPAYLKAGFETQGNIIETDTSDANIYVKKII